MHKQAPKSLRKAGQNPSGGQTGHPGVTRCQTAQPDTIVIHDVPEHCPACQAKLTCAYIAESRQVFDLPIAKCEVTEHRTMQSVCSCGHVHAAEFPVVIDIGRVLADVLFTNNLAEQTGTYAQSQAEGLRLLSNTARCRQLLRDPLLLRHHAKARQKYL